MSNTLLLLVNNRPLFNSLSPFNILVSKAISPYILPLYKTHSRRVVLVNRRDISYQRDNQNNFVGKVYQPRPPKAGVVKLQLKNVEVGLKCVSSWKITLLNLICGLRF